MSSPPIRRPNWLRLGVEPDYFGLWNGPPIAGFIDRNQMFKRAEPALHTAPDRRGSPRVSAARIGPGMTDRERPRCGRLPGHLPPIDIGIDIVGAGLKPAPTAMRRFGFSPRRGHRYRRSSRPPVCHPGQAAKPRRSGIHGKARIGLRHGSRICGATRLVRDDIWEVVTPICVAADSTETIEVVSKGGFETRPYRNSSIVR